MDLRSLVDGQTASPDWGAFAGRINNEWGGPNPRQGTKSDEAHPPIHPLKYASGLGGNEARVYELVVRHFLACVSQDARGNETVIHIEVSKGGGRDFRDIVSVGMGGCVILRCE